MKVFYMSLKPLSRLKTIKCLKKMAPYFKESSFSLLESLVTLSM